MWLDPCWLRLQVASAHAELSQKVLLTPMAPSSLNASLALGSIGIMVISFVQSTVIQCCRDVPLSLALTIKLPLHFVVADTIKNTIRLYCLTTTHGPYQAA